MFIHLTNILEARLRKTKLKHYSLVTRVCIANQLIMFVLWYMTKLWTGEIAQLKELDKQVMNFIWSSMVDHVESRVDYGTLFKPKEEGDLGLVSIKGQTFSLATKVVLLVVEEEEHTLHCIVREKIVDLSKHRWGLRDYSWLVSGCKTKPEGESKLWTNLANAWNINKKKIRPRKLRN